MEVNGIPNAEKTTTKSSVQILVVMAGPRHTQATGSLPIGRYSRGEEGQGRW